MIQIVKCGMRHFTTLIDANTLSGELSRGDLVLFDCRFDLTNVSWGEMQYAAAHLPGAFYLHLDRDLSSSITATSGRHPLPDPARLAAKLGELGVDANSQLVAYDQGNGAHAARLWWLARWLGIRNVAVLDGGVAAWRSAGLPLTDTVRAPKPRSLAVSLAPDAWVSSEAVDTLRLRPGNLLIDARGAERYQGRTEPIDTKAGHVPGARNHPFTSNLGTDGRFLPAQELRRRFDTLRGSIPPSALVAMCGSGVTACHNLLALEHAGLTGARLYAGSWSEWIRDPCRPVATGTA
jgi:thiosulfate/3-mercaptopyruvate sulfurtransferase